MATDSQHASRSKADIHRASSAPAAIDPNCFAHPLDAYILGLGLLHLQHVARTPPLSTHLKANGTVYQAGFYRLNESNVKTFVRNSSASEYHPMGTCSMGGVVDEKLMVKGTSNLRDVDASVFPLAARGNLQTLVYAVAERAANFIKEAAEEGQ